MAPATRTRPVAGRRGADSSSYYNWTVRQLKSRAKELGMTGYSTLSKEDLIFKLRYS
ncbi:Rho termination factor N-terminal domain-containing protein [Mycolicibacterium hippocampi]